MNWALGLEINNFLSDGLMTGYGESNCKIPCKKTVVEISSGQISQNVKQNYSIIFISFDQKVKVKEIKVDKFDIYGALNFLGSNMGLFPGMGLFQLLEWSFIIILSYKELLRSRTRDQYEWYYVSLYSFRKFFHMTYYQYSTYSLFRNFIQFSLNLLYIT